MGLPEEKGGQRATEQEPMMAELRSVDPRTLIPNPDNPRRTAPSKSMDEQLLASIRAIGLIQPPRVAERDGKLMIVAGVRRTKAAIAADLAVIDVLIDDADETTDAMRSVSENLIRASMTSVDIWRATEALEGQGWNEQAIADALALPVRTVKRLKLLAHLHPAMLDFMAIGSMPNEEQLRTIAAALRDEQAQVWRKLKPKKGHDVSWHEVARALSKRRIPASAARFDDDLARAYGVIWEDDLFAPAGEDSRTTTNVDGFFGAQQEWLQNNLPERGTMLPTDEFGRAALPKKAEFVYGKPAKGDLVGHYLDVHSGEVKTTVYRIVEPRRAAKGGKENENVDIEPTGATPKATRAEVSQKGVAMIGDFRTDALHEALKVSQIDETTLIALLVVAFGGRNVSVQSGAGLGGHDREGIALNLTDGGVLTTDPETVHAAARAMLTLVLSCRDNASSSGPLARSAGDTIGASLHLPNMATDDFLSCLSKAGVEKAAAAEGVRVEVRGKDTRANLVDRFKDGLYVYPPALFKLTDDEIAGAKEARSRRYVPGAGASLDDDQDGEVGTECDGEEDGGSLHGVDEDEEAFEADAEMAHAAE
jgi:ParB family chromosome partitioning protein